MLKASHTVDKSVANVSKLAEHTEHVRNWGDKQSLSSQQCDIKPFFPPTDLSYCINTVPV